MSFANPWCLSLIFLVIPILWLHRARQNSLGHSQLDLHKNLRSIPFLGWAPMLFFALAWITLCIALARPLVAQWSQKRTIETRDFIICTDISGSMWQIVLDPDQQLFFEQDRAMLENNDAQQSQFPKRINIAQRAIRVFVDQRQGDRIALLVFDDQTYYHWPLTDDLKIIKRKIPLLSAHQGGGTNFEGPSEGNPGMGPLQAAINHFREYGRAQTKVLIMVTDGEDGISEDRFETLSSEMRQLGIHVYVLGVGDAWGSNDKPDLGRFAERLGGMVIQVGNSAQMQDGFETINQMEKSVVGIEKADSFRDIYPRFLVMSIIFFVLYLGTSALVRQTA